MRACDCCSFVVDFAARVQRYQNIYGKEKFSQDVSWYFDYSTSKHNSSCAALFYKYIIDLTTSGLMSTTTNSSLQ